MSQQLIDRSSDLKRLRDEGYSLEIKQGHLLVHDIPYLTASRTLKRGSLVCVLKTSGQVTAKPDTHVMYFIGEAPCDEAGNQISRIIIGAQRQELAPGISADFTLSTKPSQAGYPDYYDEVTSYAKIIWHPAWALDHNLSPMTFRPIKTDEDESPFYYLDTASSRAGIAALTESLRLDRIAIIGLGGTGSYVLDLVAKCPVGEIHLYDSDTFYSHNAFRSPGAPTIQELEDAPSKVEYLAAIYGKMHRNVRPHNCDLTADNVNELKSMSFVFLCMDSGSQKAHLMKRLQEWAIPFVDVGMGIDLDGDVLTGIVRTTLSSQRSTEHIWQGARVPLVTAQGPNVYASNIQVADLNALNAALAVIRWKKLFGFYADLEDEHYSHYILTGNCIRNEDSPNAA